MEVVCHGGWPWLHLLSKGEASEKKLVSSHSEKVLSRDSQENSSEPSKEEGKSVINSGARARSRICCLWSRRWRGQSGDDQESCKLEN